jgi:hypothetical protein
VFALGLRADERIDRLTSEQRKWLEEEVVYLMTDIEKASFLDIEASDVRDAFIDAFWKRRDLVFKRVQHSRRGYSRAR